MVVFIVNGLESFQRKQKKFLRIFLIDKNVGEYIKFKQFCSTDKLEKFGKYVFPNFYSQYSGEKLMEKIIKFHDIIHENCSIDELKEHLLFLKSIKTNVIKDKDFQICEIELYIKTNEK